MQLQEFDRHDKINETCSVTKILGCKVWYVYDGRNAWHSTWVQKYRIGCFHLNLQSAKDFCEEKRVQGLVFYIEQIPALEIDCEYGSLFVTQINCMDPLSGYSANAMTTAPPDRKELVEDNGDNYLDIGIPFQHVAQTFERDSRFWREPPPLENSLIMNWLAHIKWQQMFTDMKGALFVKALKRPELLDGAELEGYTSKSIGGKLSWHHRASRARQNGVMEILRSIGGLADVVCLDAVKSDTSLKA